MSRTVLRALAWSLCALLLATGCGVPQEEQPRPLDRAGAPFRVFEADDAPLPQGGELQAELWFVRNDRLVPVARPIPLPGSPRQVLNMLFGGLTEIERTAGLSSAIPAGVRLKDVEVEDRIAVVTLEGLSEQVQVLSFGQIVATLDGRPDIDGVRFRSGDRDVQVPRGDGSLTDAPVNRESYAELLGLEPTSAAVPPPPVTPNGPSRRASAPPSPAAEPAEATSQEGSTEPVEEPAP